MTGAIFLQLEQMRWLQGMDLYEAGLLSFLPADIPIYPLLPGRRACHLVPVTGHKYTQSSRDNETGDRGSTTSRDSAYRDSLSGSTLGSAGFQAQLEGMNKHGLANVFVALKSAVVDQLFLKEPESTIKQDSSRILPHNVNTNSLSSSTQQIDSIQSQSEERNATPRPSDYVTSTSDAHRRSKTELDPAWTRQHVSKDQSKRTSSFVEVLANGTDLQSATNFSLRNTPPSERKNSDQVFAADSGISRVHEQLKSTNREANRLSRQKREVTFQSTSPSHKEDDDDDHLDEDLDDLGSLAGSRATENAFKSLAELDVSIDLKSVDKGEDTALLIGLGLNERMHVNDENMDDHLSAVSLPSKPKQRGGNSLKWENQLDAVSNADTSRLGANTSISHNASNMLPEQSSFSHAQGHLIRFLTGLHPWDEWDQVKSLDLTKREVESTITLNHLVPNLEVLILNDNQVLHLTGIPKTVKTLQVRSNLLDNLTNFGHLSNLQYLDISRNAIEDLTGLSGLIHLRELIAEGNSIRNLSALQQMDGLIRLDVSHNCLTSLDFRWSKLQRLEYLNASHNRIEQLENLESLAGLIHANLAHNSIEDISLLQPLRRLRILRLSENKLVRFDAMPFPGLRTLYLDDNRLQYLENCQKLTRLENFSARDQEGEGIAIDMTEFANSRKLYLSGNPVYALDFEIGFYRLEYLEICAGCLSELPLDFASLFPNLRGLNLSYNGLDSISALDGLHRLRRLIFVGNNLKSFSDVLSLLKRMRSLVTLDLRHNPLTSNMYPAMSIRQGSKYQDTYRTNQNSETELDWRRRDVGFRRALPDAMYIKRSVYRSAILKSCKRLEWFDGGAVQEKERARVPVVLSDMLNSYGRDYLTNNRREDEDEEFEFEEEYLEYYPQDELIDNQQQQDVDWLRSHMQLEQLNGDGVDNGDDDYDRDERDPEDITDHSKRPGSSVESGSLNSQHQHRSLPRRLSGSAAHQQPRRLQSRPGYQVVSPSPKGPIQPSKQSLNPSRSGDSNRLSSNAALSQQQQQQQQYTTDRPLKRLNKKPSFADKPVVFNIAPYDQQGQEQNGNEDNLECDDADIYYDGSPDKQYAVRTWRDEVNEISQRKLQSPRMLASAAGDARGILSSGLQEARPKSQQQQVLRRSDKRSVSGSGTRSSHGSHSGSISGLHRRLETSIMAVANNSSENRPVMERRSAGLRKLFNIPTPVPQQQLQQASTQQRSLMPSHRRRSDTTAAILMSSGLARPPSSTYTLNRQQPSLSRPVSQHGVLFGYESVEMGGSTVANNPMSQSYHQSSMSPMAGPIGMTSSGTILQKPNHRRRRSAGVRLSHGSSVSTRKKELLERDINNNQSPGLNGLAVSQFSPTMSPGYFGLNHHGTQSPFGFGKGTPLIGASSSRSLPNTPSKVNSGRASRISLGAGPHYGPQTLARDMELSEMAD
ncbi:hypothetical protein BCR41DRAFT_215908 [Lobosporangium transversale]|uniref:Septation initiation network scaffold protein cdc11 n=1 Tax=Lobosporangium transversale TaxID=64571 RepID=A0A1Y2G8C2_9FUNG|nr:hypothetical protein BCR41DRAFT_215908 [Lobosporangium transversale]ORY99592.1 hypothetical protein BCR41DRAFT_215908 [Lobosporangium transversale]|eukprot:XP_021875887.1 hypothetical protein BCR41DRAFT_215908 [Lobosporangium transversale]